MEFILFQIVILIFSVVLHEVSHGVVAYSLGDPTAKNAGRLTLNPLPHIDPVGSVILPLFLLLMSQLTGGGVILGWAKPVPINPSYLKDQKFGPLKVSLAGPASNLLLAIFFGLLLRFLPAGLLPPSFVLLVSVIVYLNILLGVFNLLPIPPLDGSHIFFTLFPQKLYRLQFFLSQYGFLILLFFIFFFFPLIVFIVKFLFRFIVGVQFL